MKKTILFGAALMLAAVTMAQAPTLSSSIVEFKYCFNTESHTTTTECAPFVWNGQTYTESGDYQFETTNARGCDSTAYLHLTVEQCTIDGALPGLFSISATEQVYFSKGNLQYRASENGVSGDLTHKVRGGETKNGEFRFAEHQWDIIGESNITCYNNDYISTGWMDLFGAGTSTVKVGNVMYWPWGHGTNTSCLYSEGEYSKTNYDWGWYNQIKDAGEIGDWFTMTYNQWNYLFNQRTDAAQKCSFGTVNGKKGVIILPDAWSLPSGLTFTATFNNFTTNNYAGDNWTAMETAGAVFLPNAGYRYGGNKYSANYVYYWSTTRSGTSKTYYTVYFGNDNSFIVSTTANYDYGNPVRLVHSK